MYIYICRYAYTCICKYIHTYARKYGHRDIGSLSCAETVCRRRVTSVRLPGTPDRRTIAPKGRGAQLACLLWLLRVTKHACT